MVPQAESPCNDYTEDRWALGRPLHRGNKATPVTGRMLLGPLADKRFGGAEMVTWPEILLRLSQIQSKKQCLVPGRRKRLVNIGENILINLKPPQLL